MDIPVSVYMDNKKYMWDGNIYESRDKAQDKETAYKQDGFETRLIPYDTVQFLVYSRRTASAVSQN
ncbi:MAG: hypothetical protein HZA48_03865 [Planctomycetes bacterium]|nr:hypothetical protein [Planctomycetota bacterium]